MFVFVMLACRVCFNARVCSWFLYLSWRVFICVCRGVVITNRDHEVQPVSTVQCNTAQQSAAVHSTKQQKKARYDYALLHLNTATP